MKRNWSKSHRVGTYDVCKISLFCSEDERYIQGNGINSFAYFYRDIR